MGRSTGGRIRERREGGEGRKGRPALHGRGGAGWDSGMVERKERKP
jgi:hypothetical protein